MKGEPMQIQMMKIDEIKPYQFNPRINDGSVDGVAESIKQFGWNQPIVVDKNMVVVVGHTRLKAARKLGLKEVPVFVNEKLTESQAKAYRIADNKTPELSIWDEPLLAKELKEILDADPEIYLGFSPIELETILEDMDAEEIPDTEFGDEDEELNEVIYINVISHEDFRKIKDFFDLDSSSKTILSSEFIKKVGIE